MERSSTTLFTPSNTDLTSSAAWRDYLRVIRKRATQSANLARTLVLGSQYECFIKWVKLAQNSDDRGRVIPRHAVPGLRVCLSEEVWARSSTCHHCNLLACSQGVRNARQQNLHRSAQLWSYGALVLMQPFF
jgi:hypothetical protein